LTVSWLGLWLWLTPLGRAAAVLAFVIIALAAAVPFVFVRVPAIADGLRRLDHGSGLRHRPANGPRVALALMKQNFNAAENGSLRGLRWHSYCSRGRGGRT
jgi:hypothetical protein